MAHLKRLVAPRSWPIKRKGIEFTIRQNPRVKSEISIPLAFVLRDMLKLAQKARESKRILRERNVLVNGAVRTDMKFPITIFDVIEIPAIGKVYGVSFTKLGKLSLHESEKPKFRLARVENKTKSKGGKTQLNLFDGTNVLVDKDECKTGDVVKLSIPENKMVGKISPDEGTSVFVIGGAHIGETAKIKSLDTKRTPKEVVLKGEAGEFRTRFTNVFAIE